MPRSTAIPSKVMEKSQPRKRSAISPNGAIVGVIVQKSANIESNGFGARGASGSHNGPADNLPVVPLILPRVNGNSINRYSGLFSLIPYVRHVQRQGQFAALTLQIPIVGTLVGETNRTFTARALYLHDFNSTR